MQSTPCHFITFSKEHMTRTQFFVSKKIILMKIWSSHLLDNLSNCLMNLKNSGDSTGFEPMISAMPVQCSNQLSYEVTQWRAGQFVGLMFSRERKVIWKKCYMQCGVWNLMKIWSSHLLDNLINCLMNLKNSGDSTGFEPMTSAMPVQCSNQLSYEVTQWRAGQFVGLMFSRERKVIWKKCYQPNELTCSPLCDFIAQLVRALHRHRRDHGFESPEFFRFMRQLLKLSSKCEDHIFIRFQTPHCI